MLSSIDSTATSSPVRTAKFTFGKIVPKMKSWVWLGEHMKPFCQIKHPELKAYAFCTHCERKVLYSSSTSTLTTHMFNNHREVHDNEVNNSADKTGPMDKAVFRSNLFLNRYCKWVVGTYKPFGVCNEPEFRDMINSINSKIAPIDRHHVTSMAPQQAGGAAPMEEDRALKRSKIDLTNAQRSLVEIEAEKARNEMQELQRAGKIAALQKAMNDTSFGTLPEAAKNKIQSTYLSLLTEE